MKKLVAGLLLSALSLISVSAQQKSPGAGPIIVLETVKGTIEIETYPEEAPKTVARIVELVKKNFYNGLRFHRAEPNFIVQVGDPVTRDMSRQASWGRQGSGKPIGVSEYDGKYTVFGKVLKGQDVVAKIQRGDILKRAYLKDEAAKS